MQASKMVHLKVQASFTLMWKIIVMTIQWNSGQWGTSASHHFDAAENTLFGGFYISLFFNEAQILLNSRNV